MTDTAERTLADARSAGLTIAVVDGKLKFKPVSAMTSGLLSRLSANKGAIMAILAPVVTTTVDEPVDDWADDEVVDVGPCPRCGGAMAWQDMASRWHCGSCEPPAAAIRALERVERIRRRHGIPSPPGTTALLEELKATTPMGHTSAVGPGRFTGPSGEPVRRPREGAPAADTLMDGKTAGSSK